MADSDLSYAAWGANFFDLVATPELVARSIDQQNRSSVIAPIQQQVPGAHGLATVTVSGVICRCSASRAADGGIAVTLPVYLFVTLSVGALGVDLHSESYRIKALLPLRVRLGSFAPLLIRIDVDDVQAAAIETEVESLGASTLLEAQVVAGIRAQLADRVNQLLKDARPGFSRDLRQQISQALSGATAPAPAPPPDDELRPTPATGGGLLVGVGRAILFFTEKGAYQPRLRFTALVKNVSTQPIALAAAGAFRAPLGINPYLPVDRLAPGTTLQPGESVVGDLDWEDVIDQPLPNPWRLGVQLYGSDGTLLWDRVTPLLFVAGETPRGVAPAMPIYAPTLTPVAATWKTGDDGVLRVSISLAITNGGSATIALSRSLFVVTIPLVAVGTLEPDRCVGFADTIPVAARAVREVRGSLCFSFPQGTAAPTRVALQYGPGDGRLVRQDLAVTKE